MKQIIPGLWLGNYAVTLNKQQLNEHQIGYILDASVTRHSSFGAMERNNFEQTYVVKYLHVDLSDAGSLTLDEKIEQSFAFIQAALNENNPVLVYCDTGMSRSVTLVIAYLMWDQNLSCDSALRLVQANYLPVRLNLGFAVFLRDFHWSLNSRNNEEKAISLKEIKEFIPALHTRPATSFMNNELKSTAPSIN